MSNKIRVHRGDVEWIFLVLSAMAVAIMAADTHRSYTTKIVCQGNAVANPQARSSMTAVIGSETCWREKIIAKN